MIILFVTPRKTFYEQINGDYESQSIMGSLVLRTCVRLSRVFLRHATDLKLATCCENVEEMSTISRHISYSHIVGMCLREF